MSNSIIKCVITDDEPFARKGLQAYVKKISYLQLEAVCEDAIQLGGFLKKEPVDLLFLDIEMPYLDGIDFLRGMIHPPKVIFITAFENYAVQGFDLDVLDYLLKPVSFERFLKAANKARDFFEARDNKAEKDYFFIKANGKLEKVMLDEILFLEAMENYVSICLPDRKLVTHSTLKAFQQQLPEHLFLQTHKSYIVNMKAVTSIAGNVLYTGKYQVPVSRYLKEQVREKLVNNKLIQK